MVTNISQLDKNGSFTYADYLTWRFSEMVELIKGKLYLTSPAPAERHQRIAWALQGLLYVFFKNQPCRAYNAPFDVRLVKSSMADEQITTVVQPDICVICDLNKIDERGCLGAPDWIIEIISPATIKKDLNEKFNLYEENGVKEYWIVMPDSNAVNQYVLQNNKYEYINTFGHSQKLAPAIFPNLQIELNEVFA